MIGYFLHDEPGGWFGDGHVSPAEQMLLENARGYSRDALSAFLRERYPATALPWCVGTHWFTLYDRNALYCPPSNENDHAGFMDLTQQRHEALCAAAREIHERLYDTASGREPPDHADVKYLFPSR